MKRVFRYQIDVDGSWDVEMPVGAEVLPLPPSTRNDGPVIEFWALADDTMVSVPRSFLVIGTGAPIPYNYGRFIGTVSSHGGSYIWHVFEADDGQS